MDKYKVYGPYDLPSAEELKVGERAEREFWTALDPRDEKFGNRIKKAYGLYVFSRKIRGARCPVYVGKTNKGQGFGGRVFGDEKFRRIFLPELDRRGVLQLHLIVKMTEKGKIGQNAGRYIDELESFFIALGYLQNDEIVNKRGTTFLKNVRVPGIMNTGKKGRIKDSARTLKKVLGF